jgi:hypothetical protein
MSARKIRAYPSGAPHDAHLNGYPHVSIANIRHVSKSEQVPAYFSTVVDEEPNVLLAILTPDVNFTNIL